jgi:predicted HicB family RNase H-like nuclease
MMEYKGYVASVCYESDAHCFHGIVVNISDTVHFEGTSVDELEKAFRDSVDEYIDFCHRQGEEPEQPEAAEFRLHLDPTLRREAALAAALEGEKLDTFIANSLRYSVRSTRDSHSG